MKKKIEEIFEFLNFVIVLLALIVVAAGSILVTYNIINTLIYSYYLIGIGVISLIVYIANKIIKLKFSKLEIAMFVLIFLTLLSLIGTIDYKIALWGRQNRREGLFVILTYYVLALVAANIKSKQQIKIIIGLILTNGLLNVIYGLMQTDWIMQTGLDIRGEWYYARGFNGNSMYYGAILSICYPIVLGLFINEKNIKKSIFYGILLILFTFGTLLSGSMAVLLSDIIVFMYIFIRCIVQIIKTIKVKSNNYDTDIIKLSFSIIIFVLFTVLIGNKTQEFSADIKEMENQAMQVATEKKADDSFGTGRIYIWKNTIEKIKEHFWFGVGIDNFANAFEKPLIDKRSNGIVYKAHNEYLQIMLCEGFFTGIYYIIFMITIGIKTIQTNDKIYYALLLGFACYSIQAFFGISVTRVSPIFFIVVGLLMGYNNKEILKME